MQIGVEEAVAQRLAQERLDQHAPEPHRVVAGAHERVAVRDRNAVDPFGRQHPPRGALPVHRRHAKIRVAAGVLGELHQCGGLEPQIHFDRDRARHGFHDRQEPQPPRLDRAPLAEPGGEEEGVEIALEALLDLRP